MVDPRARGACSGQLAPRLADFHSKISRLEGTPDNQKQRDSHFAPKLGQSAQVWGSIYEVAALDPGREPGCTQTR